ncbi:hypothetical protein NQ315_017597 [Exocentrus adspersus]|uniref:Leucine-rich repeat-containing protein n=1 Tax=Exocentrus adspersus TaxID=1586481 RepID=A0AAV8V5P7_9CUCU|nr:hypothetical protein NQ315_017597 [Exocentrus adspersus]
MKRNACQSTFGSLQNHENQMMGAETCIGLSKKRKAAYEYISNLFGFLTNIPNISEEKLKESSSRIIETYNGDISNILTAELLQFCAYVRGFKDDCLNSVKHLNLNGLCKSKEELNQCYVEEIVLPGDSIQSLSELQILSLRSNGIQNFPTSVLQLTTLMTLDLSDNNLLTLPPEINQLKMLQELVLDQNLLSVLPATLWELQFLKVLKVACNRLALPPDKIADMRALVLSEPEDKPENSPSHSNGLTNLEPAGEQAQRTYNFGLTELDVSENTIENLDLSAVEQLQILQYSRNSLTTLTVHGQNLVSIIAGNNRLKNLNILHPPLGLKHLDVSYNDLEALPEWLSGCSELRSLFASNNALVSLPEHLFCNEMPYLHTLQLAYNQLQYLPGIQRRLPIQELFLQNNSLAALPDNFFKNVYGIRVLNLSNNRLCDLPMPDDTLHLEKLFLTANCLIDKCLERVFPFLKNIKTLHAAYNNFTALPENCALFWTELEELVLSGNKLLRLPDNIDRMKHLAVLRVHSNLLQTVPKLSSLLELRVLDLAHNQLDRIDLTALIPPNLKFLDLSCNTKLHVDSHQFNTYRTQRPMSLVDVSGKNRTSLPLSPSPFCENDLTDYSWSVGFPKQLEANPVVRLRYAYQRFVTPKLCSGCLMGRTTATYLSTSTN